ncbi:hypothetical protein [Sorangium sp. So ce394]|uniref:hypothetical protein n=1 Tax=Sorangium sp. So ce394 TaxID=3133310 RepID=UPI003F5B76F3
MSKRFLPAAGEPHMIIRCSLFCAITTYQRVVRVRPGFDPATLERVLALAAEETPC